MSPPPTPPVLAGAWLLLALAALAGCGQKGPLRPPDPPPAAAAQP